MFPPLSEIKLLRRKLGITQQRLAAATGLSQSLIAKIERGAATPAYPKAVAIFDFLEEYGKQRELKAGQVMSKRIFWVDPDATLRAAVRKFREHDISQMPVIQDGQLAGVVSENDVLSAMVAGLHASTVRQVMEEAPPIVAPTASVKAISSLLRYCPLVAVQEKGRLLGVISKADLLEPLYGK